MFRVPFEVISLQYAFRISLVALMKLTILRLHHLTAQDRLDLIKIWPDADIALLEKSLNEHHQLYAAKFNDRLLAAVNVNLHGTQGQLVELRVREVTRRRGVGSYLLEEVLAQNDVIMHWWIADGGDEDREARTLFLQKHHFEARPGGWAYQRG